MNPTVGSYFSILGLAELSFMNLLIGLVILLCLACSELHAAEAANDLWNRLVFVALVTLSVPGLALVQTMIVSRRIRNSELKFDQHDSMLRRLSVCHSAVWLIASLAIVWAVRWQDVVRGNWNLDQWPVLDEAIILAPIVLSLVASWAIFYQIQYAIVGADKSQSVTCSQRPKLKHKLSQSRSAFVSIRFRVYFLMVLVPVAMAVLAKDIGPWVGTLPTYLQGAIYVVTLLLMAGGFPFLLTWIWKTGRIQNAALKSELLETCELHKLRVHDVRVWNTDNQIVNALVAGIIPRLRLILLSDVLIKRFPKRELLAILRHEAGHLRLWHLPSRIGFAVLPLLALAIDEHNAHGVIVMIESTLTEIGLPVWTGIAFLIASYAVYAYYGLSWLSHQMEFEADIYACQETPQSLASAQSRTSIEYACDMSDALLRLAAVNPEQIEKHSLLHPSIGSRLRMIHAIGLDPQRANAFSRSFQRRRRIVFLILITICVVAFLG